MDGHTEVLAIGDRARPPSAGVGRAPEPRHSHRHVPRSCRRLRCCVAHPPAANLSRYRPPPGFNWQPLRATPESTPPDLKLIDHIAICLPVGTLEPTVAAYQSIFDMQIIRTERTEVGETAQTATCCAALPG
jgi:hypothetical protein